MFSGQSWVEEIEFWVFEVDLTVCIVILTSSLWLGEALLRHSAQTIAAICLTQWKICTPMGLFSIRCAQLSSLSMILSFWKHRNL